MINKDEILRKTLQFTSCILQNNNPVDEFKANHEASKLVHALRMKKDMRVEQDEEVLTREDFEKELLSLKSKGKRIYNDVLKAGEGFKTDVFEFLNHIWKTETIPTKWDITTLMQVFKRGPKKLPRLI